MADLIVTHATNADRGGTVGGVNIATATYREMLAAVGATYGLTLPASTAVAATPMDAYINHGRWVAECGNCETAVVVDDGDLFFWCPRCGSGDVWTPIALPSDRSDIEAQLLRRNGWRGTGKTRNWVPGETVADLIAENRAHGIGA